MQSLCELRRELTLLGETGGRRKRERHRGGDI